MSLKSWLSIRCCEDLANNLRRAKLPDSGSHTLLVSGPHLPLMQDCRGLLSQPGWPLTYFLIYLFVILESWSHSVALAGLNSLCRLGPAWLTFNSPSSSQCGQGHKCLLSGMALSQLFKEVLNEKLNKKYYICTEKR